MVNEEKKMAEKSVVEKSPREQYLMEAEGLPEERWASFGAPGRSVEDELLWLSVDRLDVKNVKRALDAGASSTQRRLGNRDTCFVEVEHCLIQRWMWAIGKIPKEEIAHRASDAAQIALALEASGLPLVPGASDASEPKRSRKEQRLAAVAFWAGDEAGQARGLARGQHSEDSLRVERDGVERVALMLMQEWMSDKSSDGLSGEELAAAVMGAPKFADRRRSGLNRRLGLMAAMDEKLGRVFCAKHWAEVVQCPDVIGKISRSVQAKVVEGAIRALAGSDEELDAWSAGWLFSLAISAQNGGLAEGVARRAKRPHWQAPEGVSEWIEDAHSLAGGLALSLPHLAILRHNGDNGFDIAGLLLENPIMAKGASDHPQPFFMRDCSFERYCELIGKTPGLAKRGEGGDNVAHAWARGFADRGPRKLRFVMEQCFNPLMESSLASMAIEANKAGETPRDLLVKAMDDWGEDARPWRETFARWESVEIAGAAAMAVEPRPSGPRL